MSKIKALQKELLELGYIADQSTATSITLASLLQKPLLLEGPAGVGKTEIAKILAQKENTELIRLQCYEGLDATQAIYEWNYPKQLLHLKLTETSDLSMAQKESNLYSEEYLLQRPLLKSILSDKPVVLLIDEIDRADEEFESFFLELLSDWQITIPEYGTIKAKSIPRVIVTSNRMRDLSEALRRRCLYLWIDLPDFEKELKIVQLKIPDINEKIAVQICQFLQEVRKLRLEKQPGISETIDWATALSSMHIDHLDKSIVESTLGIIIKDWEDTRQVQSSLSELLDTVGVQSKIT